MGDATYWAQKTEQAVPLMPRHVQARFRALSCLLALAEVDDLDAVQLATGRFPSRAVLTASATPSAAICRSVPSGNRWDPHPERHVEANRSPARHAGLPTQRSARYRRVGSPIWSRW